MVKNKKPKKITQAQLKKQAQAVLSLHEEYEKRIKSIDDMIKESNKHIKQYKKRFVWWGLIIGIIVITIGVTLTGKEIIDGVKFPQSLIIFGLNIFNLIMGTHLIYKSFKTRQELKIEEQKEILDELEKGI
jgi:hypothetical protein